jgi:two-component system, chemotaxis family, sensor kinase CheA
MRGSPAATILLSKMPRDDDFTGEAEELLDALSGALTDFEAQGSDVRPELVNKIFRDVHSLKGLAGMAGFTKISELAHTLEDMLDKLRMGRIAFGRQLTDLLFDAVDALNRLVAGGTVDDAALARRIHQLVAEGPDRKSADALREINLDEQTRKSLTEYEEHRLLENVRSGKEIVSVEVHYSFTEFDQKLRALTAKLTESGEVISTLPSADPSGAGIGFRLLYGSTRDAAGVAAMAPDAKVTSLRGKAPREDEEVSLRSASATVRVDIAKLDALMNIIGELHALARPLGSRDLERKLIELQKLGIDLRMVPVGQIYSRLSRNARKLSRELGKDIDLVLRGEETELDKMLVEEISDPLMHIIRNALDHGIEAAAERIAAGKPAKGRVTITAYPQGNSVVIDISDDGRGIDPDRIRNVAKKKGLDPAADPFELLFTPGFSTASEVSEISGRGVGLDVVRKNIQDLKGSIAVISAPGQGTTFRIMLPITLAIVQALIVRVADQQFAIPLASVEESLRIQAREIQSGVLRMRELTLPIVRLADAFLLRSENDSPDAKLFVVVARSGEKLAGIVVDAIVRQQEIVLKSIGGRLKDTPGVAGATEVGEGEIILVIDVGSLIENFGGRTQETAHA